MDHDLNRQALQARRTTLLTALQQYENGQLSHFEEDEYGRPIREATEEHISKLRVRIAEIDRQLIEP